MELTKEFIKKVEEKVKEMLPDREVTNNEVTKNNGLILHAITIRKVDENIAPNIYIENYLECKDANEVAECIVDTYNNLKPASEIPENILEIVSDFETVKDFFRMKLINKKSNEEYLKEVPNVDFLDLSIVAYIDLGDAGISINKKMLKEWKTDAATVIDIAKKNTFAEPICFHNLIDIIAEEYHLSEEEIEEIAGVNPEAKKQWVLTNGRKYFGAVKICNYETMKEISEHLDDDLIVLPSSIHEVIILPKSLGNKEFLDNMVQDINLTEVADNEILSDHAYIFSKENGWQY